MRFFAAKKFGIYGRDNAKAPLRHSRQEPKRGYSKLVTIMTQQTLTENNRLEWASKANRFAIRVKLTPTARELWAWLMEEIGEGRHEIIDLREFQKFVVKERGRGHDFRVVQTAIARLIEAGVLKNCQKFTNFVLRLTIRPINRLIYPVLPKPKIYEKRSQIPNLQPLNTTNAVQGEITTTTNLLSCKENGSPYSVAELLQAVPLTEGSYLEQNLDMCEKAGIKFPNDAAHVVRILSRTNPEEVMEAVDYCVEYASRKQVKSMAGLFLDCLKGGWWKKDRKPLSFSDALLTLCAVMGRLPK